MDDLIGEFLTETAENLEALDEKLVSFEASPRDRATLDAIFRLLHTIKGTCGFLGLPRLEALAHAGENLLGDFRDGVLDVTPDAVSLVLRSIDRIRWLLQQQLATNAEPDGDDADLIGDLNDMVERREAASPTAVPGDGDDGWPEVEFPATQHDHEDQPELGAAPLDPPECIAPEPIAPAVEPVPAATPAEAAQGTERIRVSLDVLDHLMTMVSELVLTRNQLLRLSRLGEDPAYAAPLHRLSAITSELQNSVLKTRMQPIEAVWKTIPRVVRDIATNLGKKISLVLEGEATELDRQVLDLIKDPLLHMVRNAAGHGLETPAERLAAGKPETGVLRLSASHEAGAVIIRIADDGRGLDTTAIRRKAVERGLISQADAELISDAQAHQLVFAPGFSTAEAITSLSGRGVGLDVARSNIEQISGQIDLTSAAGQGTVFTIKIPLTLAIIPALIVVSGGRRFAVPQASVTELVRIGPKSAYHVETIQSVGVLRLRNSLLPLIGLARGLGQAQADEEAGVVLVMQAGGRRFGVIVEAVLDIEETVVKPLARVLRSIPLFSGATILGDGSVILIVDPNGLAQLADRSCSGEAEADAQPAPAADVAARTPLLLLRAGGGCLRVVELSRITRLEHVLTSQLEQVGGRTAMQYRGRLMPVLPLEGGVITPDRRRQSLLILHALNRPIALAVDEIVDAVEDSLDIQLSPDRLGVLGTAVVAGHAVEVVDLDWYMLKGMAEYGAGPAAEQPGRAAA